MYIQEGRKKKKKHASPFFYYYFHFEFSTFGGFLNSNVSVLSSVRPRGRALNGSVNAGTHLLISRRSNWYTGGGPVILLPWVLLSLQSPPVELSDFFDDFVLSTGVVGAVAAKQNPPALFISMPGVNGGVGDR